MRKTCFTDDKIVVILQEAKRSGKTSETVSRHGISGGGSRRSSAWMVVFSSTQKTTACSGGLR